ncbi:MAG: hypothetical protein A2W29_08045, partial [Gemmatimonadetes bacterium RBG_16_66_8]
PAHWVRDAEHFEPVVEDFTFDDLFFSTPTEGWIVGNRFLLHSVGDQLDLTLVNDRKTYLAGVSFPRPSEGWAAGWRDTERMSHEWVLPVTASEGTLWRYQDGKWNVWNTSDLSDAGLLDWQIGAVAFSSPVDGWALGLQGSFIEGKLFPLLFHFDGTRWQIDHSMRAEGRLWTFTRLCFDPSGRGWAVGWKWQTPAGRRRALVASREDGEWRELQVPQVSEEEEEEVLTHVSCAPGGVVAAGWTSKDPQGSNGRGVALRYDGSWERLHFPDHMKQYVPQAVSAISTDDFWLALSCVGPNESCHPLFLHFGDGRWQEIPPPVLPGGRVSGYSFKAMQFPTRDVGWAIANDYEGPGLSRGLVFHYKDGVWRNRNWNWHFWHERWFGLFGR